MIAYIFVSIGIAIGIPIGAIFTMFMVCFFSDKLDRDMVQHYLGLRGKK